MDIIPVVFVVTHNQLLYLLVFLLGGLCIILFLKNRKLKSTKKSSERNSLSKKENPSPSAINTPEADITSSGFNKKNENRFRNLFMNTSVGFYITSVSGRILEANPAMVKMLGYPDIETLLKKNVKDIFVDPDKRQQELKLLENNKTLDRSIIKLYQYNRRIIIVEDRSICLMEEEGKILYFEGSLVDITEQKRAELALKKSKEKIEEAHKDITDSITYAKTLQEGLLTPKEFIDSYFKEYFIFFRPKDQVSGDFYYINKVDDNIIFTVADCTGHGVPGSFITVIGITYLHEIVRRNEMESPGMALNIIRERVKRTFRNFEEINQNGMDMALCSINTKTNMLQYAGAFCPLWIIRNIELIEIEPTRNPIGAYPEELDFKNHSIQLQNNDLIYLFSDGFKDQFGGLKIKRFSKRKFKELIVSIHHLPLDEQKIELENAFKKWLNGFDQIDDVTVMGIKWQTGQ